MTTIISCEGYKCGEGRVLDAITQSPLENVACKSIETNELVYTDKAGNYEICGEFGSCLFGCKELTVEFSKDGYKTKIVDNPKNNHIYLER